MKLASALLIAALGLSIAAPGMAETSAPTRAAKPAPKKAQPKKAPESNTVMGDDDDDGKEMDISKSIAVEYNCEMSNSLTIFANADDRQHIALRWKKQIMRMRRVDTTTGANRFENRRSGWVWIGIPAKGILLNAKEGHQMANECKSTESVGGLQVQ